MTGKDSGLTLMELLISLGIVSIVTFMIVPSFVSMIDNVRGYQAIHKLKNSLVLARSEAIKRNRTVRICPSQDGSSCTKSLYWESGWIIYLEGNSIYRQPVDEVILRGSAVKGLIMRKNGNEKTVKFSSVGAIGLGRSFSLCSALKGLPIRRIVLSRTGRIRLASNQIQCS